MKQHTVFWACILMITLLPVVRSVGSSVQLGAMTKRPANQPFPLTLPQKRLLAVWSDRIVFSAVAFALVALAIMIGIVELGAARS